MPKPLKLQYDEPAPDSHDGWESWALPLGNGHMGAMIFGGTDTERIQLNEKTLWSGGPGGTTETLVQDRDPLSDVYGNVDAWGSGAMSQYIEKIFTDYYNHTYTGAPPQSGEMKILPNHRLGLGSYTNFAELYLDLNHTGASDYHRELDLRTGLSTVTHTYNGVVYTRETFASHPNNVIVYRISANQNQSVDMTVRAEIPFNNTAGQVDKPDQGNDGRKGAVTADLQKKTLCLDGVMDNGMTFSGDFRVIPQGGTMTVTGAGANQFRIEDADSVMIVVALATNYKNKFPSYRQEDPAYSRKNVEQRIAAVDGESFDELYKVHYEDYNELFSRVELDLGGVYNPDETTDQLLNTWKEASASGNQNHYLEELYFQYGRYMLIASSREDTLPANLQGIWADQKRPPWQGDYHTNINLQMNYWPAYTTNLAETGEALIRYVDSLQAPGALTAKKLYGVEDTWMVNCSASAMGFTGNINSPASLASTASAFILQNIYDAYEFTRDRALLENTLYPMMKSACKLFTDTLQPGRTELDQDRLFWAPSYSSEQGQTWTVGAAFDQQLIYMLFADTVEAANTLGVDADFAAKLEDMMARLHPVEIGLDGQIKEYQQEGRYLTDLHTGRQIPGTDKQHRHNSQLMVVHPGDLITTETPEYMEAARKTLNLRGDGATGWSMGQKLNMWARLHDGNHAYNKLFVNLMKNGTATNLFDFCPPFQIDGNFGGTAGLAEMLLQSHAGYVDILPALPDALGSGSVTGLVAEGNFVVDLAWADMKPTSLRITSRSGGALHVKAGAVSEVTDLTTSQEITAVTHNEDGSIGFATEQGHTYGFTFGAADLTALAAKTAEFANYSSYAYTGDTAAFEAALTTARRVAEQGHCYTSAVGQLAGRLDTAFAALTARKTDEYGAVLSLRLKDRVEAAGISTELQNAYRVYGAPVIEASEAMLDSGASAGDIRAQGLALVQTLEKYGKLSARTELYGLLADLCTTELEGNVFAESETVFLDPAAGAEQINAAAGALRRAAEGKVEFYTVKSAAGIGGSIAPAVDTQVRQGTALTFTVTPQEGYDILDVVVNGRSVGPVNSWTLEHLSDDLEIEALFQPIRETSGNYQLRHALALKEKLNAEDHPEDQWAAVEQAAAAAEQALSGTTEAEKCQAAAALLDTIKLLSVSTVKLVEAESEGLNVAWDDSWDAGKSGMPREEDVKVLINGFRNNGKTIIVGYGEKGKTHSNTNGATNMQWEVQEDSRMSAGAQLISRAKDPWLEFTFVGDRIELITEKALTSCMADIYIDDAKVVQLDLSSTQNPSETQCVVFDTKDYESTQNLSPGPHSIRIHAVGVGEISAVGAPYQILRVDAFRVFGEAPMADRGELAIAVAEAETKDSAAYTAESWNVFSAALKSAVTVLEKPSAGQDKVDAAKQTLQRAQDGLVVQKEPITAVVPAADCTVPVGIAFQSLPLPETVVIRTDSGAYACPVTWVQGPYDCTAAATYLLSGTLQLDGSRFNNPEGLSAEIRVTVTAQPHVHHPVRHEAKAATCRAPGNIEYWICSGEACEGIYYADEACTTRLDSVTTPVDPDNHVGGTELRGQKEATWLEEGYTGDLYCKGCDTLLEKGKTTPRTGSSISWIPGILGAVTSHKLPFTDVAKGAWYYENVYYAWDEDLIDGVTVDKYQPDGSLTVAQAIKLAAALHEKLNRGYVTLQNGKANWYDTYVDYAVNNSIIESKYQTYTKVQMNAAITRNEFVHIFHGAMGSYKAINTLKNNAIPDVKMNDVYADEIYDFYRAGILTGSDGAGTFNGKTTIKRSEVAAILIRMFDTTARKSITLN